MDIALSDFVTIGLLVALEGLLSADNALVIRFKFKARPGNPGRIQDEAVQRMLRTFPAQGLQLA